LGQFLHVDSSATSGVRRTRSNSVGISLSTATLDGVQHLFEQLGFDAAHVAPQQRLAPVAGQGAL
jgi:hypothetical protein